MPYIKQEQRKRLDWIIDNLAAELESEGMTGNLNYVIFRLCKKFIKNEGENYANYKSFVGELECAKSEILRRLVAKYEEKKIKENGDVD